MGTFFLQSGELAENVSKIIESQFAEKIDISDVQVELLYINFLMCSPAFKINVATLFCLIQDEFSAVITKALLTLVNGVETKFDAEMIAMSRVPWANLLSVGDQSE